MKVRTVSLVYCAFLISLLACRGIVSSSNQMPSNMGTPPPAGGMASGAGSMSSELSPGGHLYVIENPNAASSVEAFSISRDGALTHVSTANAGFNAADIVADSRFVFVGHSPLGQFPRPPIQLISYSIGGSGELITAGQVSSSTDDTLGGILLDHQGRRLYVSSSAVMIIGRASTFSIDTGSGEMTPQPPDVTTLPLGRMAISPNGLLIYAPTFPRHHTADLPGIRLLRRDPATGNLTDAGRKFPGPQQAAAFYSDLAFSTGGQHLLALAGKITVFAVNPATGDLTVASELPGNFTGMTVDQTGRFLIVTDSGGTVTSYRIQADGTLTIQGTAMAVAGVRTLTVDVGNKFVYVQNSTAPQIFAFSLDPSSGALVTVPGSPFTATAQPIRMAAVGR